jgi:diguanylate cyclase (GGDEF)-like protein
VIFYVMATALFYIAVGYYLGRRLFYARLPQLPLDRVDDLTQSQQIEAVVEGLEASAQSSETHGVSTVSSAVASAGPPAKWMAGAAEAQECQSHVEGSVQALKLEVGGYRERLVNIDGAIRECLRAPNAEKLQAAVDQLRQVNSDWMRRQAEAASYLLERRRFLGDLTPVRDRLDEVLQTQATQIEATCANVEMFNFQTSPMIGARRLMIEMRKLVDLSHTLRDCMQELLLMILAREGRLDVIDKALQTDPLTGLRNRAGIETSIRKWWKDDGRRIRQVSVGMIDVDRFSSFVERYGVRITDQVLSALARIVDDALKKSSGLHWCGRFGGQRFLIFWADTGPHAATSVVERIRQMITQTTFELPQGAIEVTLSAAVSEVFPDDTTKSLFKRLNWTLREAKQSGRNRTFLFDNDAPAAVDPPQFDVRGKIARLDVE